MNRPWFPFYVGDYTRDTARLTTEAHGAYLLLILDYWVNGAPPDDDEVLATITKLPVSIWRKRRSSIASFFKMKDGRWVHSRIEKEIEAANEKHQKRVEAGGKGGKAKANGKQNPSNATSNAASNARAEDEALPYQSQSQSHPPSNPEPKSRESNSPSKNFGVIEGGQDRAIPIDENYEPSDRAIEYAYSLGMKKADLNAELSKFIALSMASRITSYNPDMNFKVFCDRWLEFKLRRDPNWKPEPAPTVVEVKPFVLVIENTLEASCWAQHNRDRGLRPLFFCKQIKDGNEVIAARCDTLFPPGYDEATGERIQSAEDAA